LETRRIGRRRGFFAIAKGKKAVKGGIGEKICQDAPAAPGRGSAEDKKKVQKKGKKKLSAEKIT